MYYMFRVPSGKFLLFVVSSTHNDKSSYIIGFMEERTELVKALITLKNTSIEIFIWICAISHELIM